ncbi:nucleoside-diphosphate kinase [candidate division WWE3 bacterium CG_4_9_14_3_um_filter_41_6]|uniref:nucleoside-diphosphate kinase n=1 Tax=candidate division WWE3 bacterium CG_4_10_14_0_2_um_filter_41_14 TaxID=1975072 RepID=A0A2M7TI96_UNCKA|nr:MAG: nucleoside-diphosphate kinase [candidate division WWE3 bacterium CG_4_10_14_0_2_um_filter_41_14]PJA38785.1 MAG: nucleoside-diphosphate kinase [candidate division WWE3 bacterium CG_4_9_14_3_um_filter_41_6]
MERTVIIIKHDGVARGLMGEIMQRYERVGLKLVAMKLVHATEEVGHSHYPDEEAWYTKVGERSLEEYENKGIDPIAHIGTADKIEIGKLVKKWNVEYLTEGPVLAMIFEGYGAIKMGRKITGETNPSKAVPGTVRGDYTIDNAEVANAKKRPFRNLIHSSGSDEEAANEIELWFTPDEIHDYIRADADMMFK